MHKNYLKKIGAKVSDNGMVAVPAKHYWDSKKFWRQVNKLSEIRRKDA